MLEHRLYKLLLHSNEENNFFQLIFLTKIKSLNKKKYQLSDKLEVEYRQFYSMKIQIHLMLLVLV
jgi:hypothetical protein